MCNFFLIYSLFTYFFRDTLLLEVGFITILVAPLGFYTFRSGFLSSLPHRPHDSISMWLVKWLLFRFMFASGVVKLTSMCPTWWDLTGNLY